MKKFSNWLNNKLGWFFTNGMKTQYQPLSPNELDMVSLALTNAYQMGVEVEVVTWALKYMKENPSLTVDEAITLGYFECVK